ncbi:hypothetical protein LWI29_035200 [Acer saccharum]|uniref:Retrotransposon gag domain-containing protein n=1 Tax=Acer saccharum TaxID=4024 RepID=A0AA39SE80_ACESA|nr:hypothetical protein LWI29_035200 [Acer saccharum]
MVDHVTLASFHLEGDAQLWYQLLKQERITITYKEFKQGLHTRFGPNQFFNFLENLPSYSRQGKSKIIRENLRNYLLEPDIFHRHTKLYEARDLAHRPSKVSSTNFDSQNGPVLVPIKRLTTKEIDERRKKGLCFKCNEHFGPRHRCKKLCMIQACFNDSDADEEMEITGESLEIQWPP